MDYTTVQPGIVVCDDCGAYAGSGELVQHHQGCDPGASKRWAKYYNEQDEDDDGDGTMTSHDWPKD